MRNLEDKNILENLSLAVAQIKQSERPFVVSCLSNDDIICLADVALRYKCSPEKELKEMPRKMTDYMLNLCLRFADAFFFDTDDNMTDLEHEQTRRRES